MGAEPANDDADAVIARLAARQHGVVSAAQLEHAGISRRGRERRLRTHRLHRVHRGVYAVGHVGLPHQGRWMAAVLALGPQAVLSHGSAAALWGLLPAPDLVHVTVPGKAGHAHRDGIRVHHSLNLAPPEATRRAGIPVTTPSRTLFDLRRTLPRERFAQALRRAEFLRLRVDRALRPDRTRSELEARFLAFCRRRRLPAPQVNVRIGPYLVDFAWPDAGLVVEVDGYRTHGTRSAFEADRERDAELKLLGHEVIRFTWRRLAERPAEVAATVRTLLRRRAGGE